MFWQNYLYLCRSIGKAPTVVAVEIGLSDAAPTGWKNGVIPRQSTLKRIADYFDVSVESLLYGEQENPAPTNEGGLTDSQKELIRLLPLLTDYEVSVVLATAQSLINGRTLRDGKQ